MKYYLCLSNNLVEVDSNYFDECIGKLTCGAYYLDVLSGPQQTPEYSDYILRDFCGGFPIFFGRITFDV